MRSNVYIKKYKTKSISKGKAHKPYELGCKTSIVTTARSNRVLGVKSFQATRLDESLS